MNTPKKVLLRSESLVQKLSKYSAATVGGVVGTFACFESSEAALVFNPLGKILPDGEGSFQEFVDLNGDAVDDLVVTVFSANILTAQGLNGASIAGTQVGTFFYPTAFGASDTVDGGLTFGGGDTASPSMGTLANSYFSAGNWFGGNAGYLGVEFEIGGDTHYGWVHVTWDPGTDTATLHSYAFENVADVGAAIPEPSGLLLLGLGAMGLATRRRRQAGC